MSSSNDLLNGSNNHVLSNNLREMLGISNNSTQEAPTNGSGSSAVDMNQSYDLADSTNLQEDAAGGDSQQTIVLDDVPDGDCVLLTADDVTITSSLSSELDSVASASNKIKITTITKFDWEPRYYLGNLISVTNKHIAYSIKGRPSHSVRVINRENASDRVLLKGLTGVVCDVAFSHSTSDTLAVCDSDANFVVWKLDLDQDTGNIAVEKKLHVRPDGSRPPSPHSRVIWIPHVDDSHDDDDVTPDDSASQTGASNVIVWSYGKVAEVWDLNIAFQVAGQLGQVELDRSQLQNAFATIDDYDDDISDCELAPVGNVLAAASFDGNVKFWQVDIEEGNPPDCLHRWKPHGGKSVSALKFCDNKKKSEHNVYWRFLLTGCERNSELKIWCTVTWSCLQQVRFHPCSPAHISPQLNLVVSFTSEFVVLSDIHRKVMYVMRCTTSIEDGRARLSSVSPFRLTAPLLSVAFVESLHAHPALKNSEHGAGDATDANLLTPVPSDGDDDDDDKELADVFCGRGDSIVNGDDKEEGVLIKLIAIQPKMLQSMDVRFVPTYSSAAEDDNDDAFNTITVHHSSGSNGGGGSGEKLVTSQEAVSGDDVFLHNIISTNPSPPLPIADVISGAVVRTNGLAHSDDSGGKQSQYSNGLPATSARSRVDDIGDADHRTPESGHSHPADPSLAPDVTRSSTPPVLLTPEAFMGHHLKSPGHVEQSANSSFTNVTPYTNMPSSFYQSSTQDSILLGGVRSSLSSLLQSPASSTDHQDQAPPPPRSPPPSPVEPSSASYQPPVASSNPGASGAGESFLPQRMTKSPDLISSTSSNGAGALDESGNKAVDGAGGSVPSGSGAAPSGSGLGRTYTISALTATPEGFPPTSSLHSTAAAAAAGSSGGVSTSSSWPKAPDVTMSRPLSVRTPPPVSSAAEDPSPHEVAPRVLDPPHHPFPASTRSHPDAVQQQQQVGAMTSALMTSHTREVIRAIEQRHEAEREVMTACQREMQQANKKQQQANKAADAALKRSELQGEKLERTLKTMGEQHKRLTRDVSNITTQISEATGNQLEQVVRSELKRTVAPGISQCLDPFKDQLRNTVVQQLAATDAAVKDSVVKTLKSKELVEMIATTTAKSIHGHVQGVLPEIFFNAVVPAFERSCQSMFAQLSAAYHRGTDEVAVKLEKQLQNRLKPEQERLQAVTKEAGDAAQQLQLAAKKITADVSRTIQKEVAEQVDKALGSCEERIAAQVRQVMKQEREAALAEQRAALAQVVRDAVSQALDDRLPQLGVDALGAGTSGGPIPHRPALVQHRANFVDQQQQILKLLQKGNLNTAFQTALTASDLNLVMYVCETVDPAVVFGVSPCPLQQPILLSLIQQLSSDLTTKTEIKLKYLQEAVMNLDRRHQVTQEYMHSVLSALVKQLHAACTDNNPPSLGKDIKMLAMASQSLMK